MSKPERFSFFRCICILCLGFGFWLAGAAFIFSPPCALAGQAPLWAEPIKLPGAENFHKVSSDLYRAAQPSRAAMRAYADFGIRTVINLRGFHSDKSLVRGTGLRLMEIPIHTWEAGRDDNAVAVLQAIRDAEKPVLVHCMHGADRTGMTVALYRMVEQGWTREQALDEMRNGGFGFHTMWDNITDYLESLDIEKIRQRLR